MSDEQLELAAAAWRAFRSDSPVALCHLLETDSQPPMIEISGKKEEPTMSITSAGMNVLAGTISRPSIMKPGRWIGGVHLAPGKVWCRRGEKGEVLMKSCL